MKDTGDKQTASMEDYLEAIAVLKERDGRATVTALSESVGVRKPSVDWALKKLAGDGLVIHEKYGDVELTPEGKLIAGEVYRRHKALYSFLTDILKIDPAVAGEDACRMEHALSRQSISRLEKFIDFITELHPGRPDWGEIFNRYVARGKDDREIKSRFAGKA